MPYLQEFSYRTCPWCNTQDVAMELKAQDVGFRVAAGGSKRWSWLGCPRCGNALSIQTNTQHNTVIEVVPNVPQSSMKVDHLPVDVEEYYTNAQTVLNAGVPSSAAVELRRTLEAAAQHQGISERTLVKAIEKLAEAGLITNNFIGVLGHIRKVGNVGAHAGDQSLTREEVEKAMTFTTQVLRNLFEMPKELELLGAPAQDQTQSSAEAD